MKTKLSFLIATIFSVAAYSQTPVPAGNISGIWDTAGSPYLVQGETTIPDDSTLIIKPGVRVEWQGSYTMFVQGRILAQGTETDSITFIAADPVTGWRSIRFLHTLGTNDTSRFEYCVFRYGKVYGYYPDNCGGAIGVQWFSKLVIDHCLFDRNEATSIISDTVAGGGAIALDHSSPVIMNNRFTNNLSLNGGAMTCYGGSNALVYNNDFIGNSAVKYEPQQQGFGGALLIYISSNPTISYNTFSNNNAGYGGGAIFCGTECNPKIDHNLIYNNVADSVGGGIDVFVLSNPLLLNNTIAGNESKNGGGIYIQGIDSISQIKNTILWENTASSGGNQVYIFDSNRVINFTYCDIEGGKTAFGGKPHTGKYENCIDSDPLFEDPSAGLFSLQNCPSPCINKGDPDSDYNDPDGSRNDMGALWPPVECLGIPEVESAELIIYPNPAHYEVFVEYELVQPSVIGITLFNQLGQLIRVIPVKSNTAGKQKFSIDVGALPKGVYFIRLQNGNEAVTRKIVKV